jgi:hypothetical protein
MDGTDNGYESFLSFPLFYILGGSEFIHQTARKEWDAITWQYASYGTVDREFVTGFDWFHHSESYTYIYYLAMADPEHFKDRSRALSYAAMYMGEDPLAPNWDADKRMIRAGLTTARRILTTTSSCIISARATQTGPASTNCFRTAAASGVCPTTGELAGPGSAHRKRGQLLSRVLIRASPSRCLPLSIASALMAPI